MLWHIVNTIAQCIFVSKFLTKILPLTETLGLEAQQRTASESLHEKKAKKTSVKGKTNVEKNWLEFDNVGQKSSNQDFSLCWKCSMSITITPIPFDTSVATDGTASSAVS